MNGDKNINDYVELLKIYWEEWRLRTENYWRRILQYFVAILFVSTLPITYHTLGEISLPQISLYIFPIVGILLMIVFLWYCLSETYRIVNMDTLIKRIISENFGTEYSKAQLVPLSKINRDKDKPVWKIFNMRITIWMPIFLAIIELLLSVYVIIIIALGFLNIA